MLRAIQSKLLKEGLTERSNSQEIVDFQISFQMMFRYLLASVNQVDIIYI